ncbi:hypothetical protein M501DRAFT_902877, partial [Patellaria atrata CBS 101060]
GAILAQVAITSLSLSNLYETHWTAVALFIASLVHGCLAVYVSVIAHSRLSARSKDDEIKDWLRKPQHGINAEELTYRTLEVEDLTARVLNGRVPVTDASHEQKSLHRLVENLQSNVGSSHTAFLLSAPRKLLNRSLLCFILGMAIYLGLIMTRRLNSELGYHGSIAVFVVFIITAFINMMYY